MGHDVYGVDRSADRFRLKVELILVLNYRSSRGDGRAIKSLSDSITFVGVWS